MMQNHSYGLLAALLLAVWGAPIRAQVPQPVTPCPPACPPGYMIVEQIYYQEVIRKVCKVVPEVKKVTRRVYSVKKEDYCFPKCTCPHWCGKGCDTDCCPACDKPRTRKILLKKEVTEDVHSLKCVVEEIREVVPCKVYVKIPCPPQAPCPLPMTGSPQQP